MGLFDQLARYTEPGKEANTYNVEEFGTPAKSLFTSTTIMQLFHHIDVKDENENLVYQSEAKFPSLHDKTDVTDMTGRIVAHMEKKLFSLHNRHTVTMADGTQFDLSSELFHVVKDIINIDGLGWQIRGNILAVNFQLYDRDGSIIAVISQKMVSAFDKFRIDLYKPEYEETVVAILITLQHILRDRESTETTTSASVSSD